VLALSAHFEAGHNWLDDVPAKRRSAQCAVAAMAALRQRFGPDVPIVIGGDFNMQKTQLHYRILSGEAGSVLPEYAPPPGTRLIDCFDAWQHDCPADCADDADFASVPAPGGTVGAPGSVRARAGGCDGTTWHNWRGVGACVATSDAMRDAGIQHRSRLDGTDGGARGHQRHIDAVLVSAQASAAGRARVRRVRVVTGKEVRCAGACALRRLGGAAGACGCEGRGRWGSDHFPVVADLTLFF
jgi:hypothetical protein